MITFHKFNDTEYLTFQFKLNTRYSDCLMQRLFSTRNQPSYQPKSFSKTTTAYAAKPLWFRHLNLNVSFRGKTKWNSLEKARLLIFSHLISYFRIAISKRTCQRTMYIWGAITKVKSIPDLCKLHVTKRIIKRFVFIIATARLKASF